MSTCQQCGMWVDPRNPYHPYAACLMFMGCKNGNTVQANLDAVVAKGAQYDSGFDDMADEIAAFKARVQALELACKKAEETFDEFSCGLTILGRPQLAQAAKVEADYYRNVLAGSALNPEGE